MYSDQNYFLFCIFVVSIIALSLLLLTNCKFAGLGKFCNLLIVLFYIGLIYILLISIKETKKSDSIENKYTRYVINSILLLLVIILWIFNLVEMLRKKQTIVLSELFNNTNK